jgi:hypothetical protein
MISNSNGKPLNDFDILMMRVTLKTEFPTLKSYLVYGNDGTPLFGNVEFGHSSVKFINTEWRQNGSCRNS